MSIKKIVTGLALSLLLSSGMVSAADNAKCAVTQKGAVDAKIIYTGNSSMHIALEVNACDPKSLNRRLTTNCIVIMVAVDQNGQSEQIPQWIPETEADIKQNDAAMRLMEARKKIGEEMQIFAV